MYLGTGINSIITNSIVDEEHFHSELEVIFVIEGQVKIYIRDISYTVEKEQIFLINSTERHKIINKKSAIIYIIKYSYPLLRDMIGEQFYIFSNSVINHTMYFYEKMRTLLKECVFQYVNQPHKTKCIEQSLLYEVLDCLIENCLLIGDEQDSKLKEANDDMRIRYVFQYVNQNFQSNISLSEIAKKLYLSTSTLSRIFKKKTRIYFADYVSQMRMNYAVHDLIYTKDNITKIAIESGFSNLSVFNRNFQNIYSMSPSNYRKRKLLEIEQQEIEQQKLQEELKLKLKENQEEELRLSNKIIVTVSEEKGKLYEKKWKKSINVGAIHTMMLVNTQYHVLYLVENLGFQYIRLWNIFSKHMMITDGKTKGNYNFDKLDIVFDFLVSNKMIPFLDMGVRPNVAIKAEGENIYFEEVCIKFESRELWEHLFESFFKHIIKRYGEEEVSKWIFEISQDVIHKTQCYEEKNYDYFNVYHYMYHTIKTVLPKASVGGAMGIAHFTPDFLRDFFIRTLKQGCEPDFVSFVLFPYMTVQEGGISTYNRANHKNFELEEVKRMCKLIKEAGIKSKIYISEWNNSLSSRNYLNDSCFRAAYMVHKINEVIDYVDMITIWMASDWVSNYMDTRGVANGGNGLLTKDTICKPAYFAVQFLNSLGDYIVAKGENYIVTKTEQQEYYILAFNYKWFGSNYFEYPESITNPRIINDIFENNNTIELNIIIKNIQGKKYVAKRRTVSPKEGNLLKEWEKFQFDSMLSSQDVKYLRQSCYPRMSMERIEAKNEELIITIEVIAHEITMIHIVEEMD